MCKTADFFTVTAHDATTDLNPDGREILRILEKCYNAHTRNKIK